MNTNLTAQDLIDFEVLVGNTFKSKQIKGPIHLCNGNEEKMIEIFKDIRDEDWVFCTWRSHYHCLLKGVSPERMMEDIKTGKSISLNYADYKVFSSGLVGGTIPIANGVALSIKRQKLMNHVYCFIGEMAAETGCFHENYKYSVNHELPITWIIEDNEKSVCTDTRIVWNTSELTYEKESKPKIIYYKYKTIYPHSGVGERIQF